MKVKTFMTIAACLVAVTAFAQTTPELEYEFTTIKENPITSIKNQYRS